MVYGIDEKTKLPYLHMYHDKVFYDMYVNDDNVIIDAFYDNGIVTSFDTYEVAILFPVSKDVRAFGHLDMLVVIDKDKHVVACSDNADWILSFIQCEDDQDYIEVYEKMFNDIIKQINFGGINYVGK